MRKDVLNWRHQSHGKTWVPFLDLFEEGPVSNKEFDHIVKNSGENVERNAKHNFNPVRKCLNAIHNQDKFIEKDLTEIDHDFLNGNGKKVNFKTFLNRIEKYPMPGKTFTRLINSPNTTGDFDKYKQNAITQSRRIIEIANRLHRQDKYTQTI